MEQGVKPPSTLMRRVKAQTEVLVPLLRRLRAELGEEKANALVYPALRDYSRKWAEAFASSESKNPVENFYKTSDALEALVEDDVHWDILKNDVKHLEFNVTGCKYANFFRHLGEPELGAILTCELDDHIADLLAPTVKFSRADTMMNGGTHCPFRYRFRDDSPGE